MIERSPVVILGGGIAGLLCASVLKHHGVQALVVDRPTSRRPQLAHVHFFDSWTWSGLEHLLPELRNALLSKGVPEGGDCNYSFENAVGGQARPLPTMLELDHSVRELVSAECDIQSRLLHLSLDDRCWSLVFDDSRKVEAPLLIDASGRARASFSTVAKFIGQPLPIDTGPRASAYVSQVMTGVELRRGQLGFRVRDKSGMGALMCRDGKELWRLTLQLPPGGRIPANSEGVMQLVSKLDSVRARYATLNALPVGRPIPFGAQAAECVAIADLSHPPDGWLVLGDALLSTAPHLGWGLAQIVEQVLAIAAGLQQNISMPDLRRKLGGLAYERWAQATTRDALIALSA